MATAADPIIAIIGNVRTDPDAPAAAEALGRELAKAGFRILAYSSDPDYLEGHIIRGYVASRLAGRCSVQIRYPLHGQKPAFLEQQSNAEVFDWRPDHSPDWEVSFYQSISEVDGVLIMGGGDSTLIAGLVAMGYRIAILPLARFGGNATKIWEALRPGRDLPTADEISLMARPGWSDDQAADCVKALRDQMARKAELEKQRRLEERRRESSVAWHAGLALLLFLLSVISVPVAWGGTALPPIAMIWLLFVSPLFAGIAGATIRLVFDLRQGAVPLTAQSTLTTAALGLIAGGVAGLLFITAQVSALAPVTTASAPVAATAAADLGREKGAKGASSVGQVVSPEQAGKLVPFGILVGFIAGLTLDAVFRKLIASDVVDVSVVETRKRP